MKFKKFTNLPTAASAAVLAAALAGPAAAQVVFDFEAADQLDGNAAVSGDLNFWVESTNQALTGSQSLAPDDTAEEPFRSMTYDVPIAIDEGTISVWFYDTVGQGAGTTYIWSGSIILEDANDPTDFIAVEIVEATFGPPGSGRYWATEGLVDRGVAGDRVETGDLALRTVGWREVVFNITPTVTDVSVDGESTGSGSDVRGPGSSGRTFRLRIMADSATAGGSGVWSTSSSGFPATPGAIYIDDITFDAVTPAAVTETLDFEDDDGFGNPEYDTVGTFMGPAAYNEPNMSGFVNNFAISTAQAHSGTNSIVFEPGDPVFQSIVIDLSTASPGTITIPFYDTLGQNQDFDKVGAAFIIEDGNDPSAFIAAEIWNAPYPFAAAEKNYYFTERPIPGGARDGFYSDYFGARATGWQTLEIELTNTYSRMTINGVGADGENGGAVYDGPGLDSNPKLRIMADSPTLGGFNSWQDNANWTDPETPELDTLYLDKFTEYLYLDDVSVPLPASTSVNDWVLY